MSNEYEVYRTTTLGLALQETLDDMITSNQLKKDMALRIFKEYDKAINKALRTRINNKVTFKSKLDTYRNCDNVWTLLFNGIDITFPDRNSTLKLETATKVKIVACEAKNDKKTSKNQSNYDD